MEKKGCEHPINQVDDNNYCWACDKLLPVKQVDKNAQIAALEAQNAALVEALYAHISQHNKKIQAICDCDLCKQARAAIEANQ